MEKIILEMRCFTSAQDPKWPIHVPDIPGARSTEGVRQNMRTRTGESDKGEHRSSGAKRIPRCGSVLGQNTGRTR